MLHESISQRVEFGSIWQKVRSWVSRRDKVAPGLFLTGSQQELFTDEGVIEVRESGIYFISAAVTINKGNHAFDFGIFTSSGEVSTLINFSNFLFDLNTQDTGHMSNV